MEKSPSPVEGARLEIVYRLTLIEGSNPSFSATGCPVGQLFLSPSLNINEYRELSAIVDNVRLAVV